MNRPIRGVAVAAMAMFLALLLNVSVLYVCLLYTSRCV